MGMPVKRQHCWHMPPGKRKAQHHRLRMPPQIGLLAGIYPGVWGATQLLTGALSDRVGRKGMIVGGMLLQGVAIGLLPLLHGFGWWALTMALLGLGTALVYPTLLAAVADVAHPNWRASAVGVYRLWRDSG